MLMYCFGRATQIFGYLIKKANIDSRIVNPEHLPLQTIFWGRFPSGVTKNWIKGDVQRNI